MSLAIRLLGGTAILCLLCCALPATSLFAAGVFEVGARNWGIAGGITFLIGAAALVMLASRKPAMIGTISCHCSPGEGSSLPALGASIACALSSADYQERVMSIRELAARSLVSARRTPLSLHLVYAQDALELVRQLVRDEQSCCAFLDFKLVDRSDGVHLSITAPEEAAEAADLLFAHFAPEFAHQNS